MTTEQGDLSEAEEPEETSGTERCGVHQSLRVSSNHKPLHHRPVVGTIESRQRHQMPLEQRPVHPTKIPSKCSNLSVSLSPCGWSQELWSSFLINPILLAKRSGLGRQCGHSQKSEVSVALTGIHHFSVRLCPQQLVRKHMPLLPFSGIALGEV